MAITKASLIDLNGNEMILDADADTTITADTDDQIDIKVGGTDLIRIDASGLGVGIVPAEILDLKAASGDTRIRLDAASGSDTEIKFFNAGVAQFTIGHDDGSDTFRIGGANVDDPHFAWGKDGSLVVTCDAGGHTVFNENSVDADFRVESDGNANMLFVDGGNDRVGIGIGTPETTLDIRTSNGSDAKLRIGSSSSIGLDVLGTIEFFSADADDSGIKASIHNLSTGNQGPGGSLSGNLIFSTTASDGGGNDNPTERMRIQSDGDFFLNTTSAMANCFASFQDGNNGEAMFGISAKDDSNVGIRLGVGTDRKWVMYRNTSDDLIFYNNASSGERVRFLDAGGIAFNGDTAAANALDDYEEGTWTPSLRAGSSAMTVGYEYGPTARYTKIGRMVHVHLGFRLSSISGESGTVLRVYGLPFASISTGGYQEDRLSAFLAHNPTADHSGNMFGFVVNGGSYIEFRYLDGGDTGLPSNALDSNTAMSVYGIYYTNS